MEEILDIILNAIDNASSVFEDVSDSVDNMSEDIETATGYASSDFEEMESNVNSFQSAVDSIDDNTIEELAEALDITTEEAERLIEAGEQIGSIPFDEASANAQEYKDSMEEAADSTDKVKEKTDEMEGSFGNLANILEGLGAGAIFEELSSILMDCADKAGTFEDSLMRARLEAEGAGIDVNEMTDAVSELSSTTGRAGSEIRESFIKATARGITDIDSFKSMMEGAGAQATLLGTDIQSMGEKFSSMAMRSTLMERALASTGITMEELAEAMGMSGATADEVKDKWKDLDVNQRAAILGQAAAMNEGQTANEEFKDSWAGLHEQIDIAKGRIMRVVGEVLLPVLVPALQVASRVLKWLGDTISDLLKGPFGTLISVIGASAAAFVLAVPAYMAVTSAIEVLKLTALPAALALWEMVAPLLPFIILGAAIAYVVYEIGKAFGWWTDVGSMIDAIWAGIQRLWSAFINHPDIKGFINDISNAWRLMSPYLNTVIDLVLRFFKVDNKSSFDIVRTLINTVSKAWQAMTAPIRLVISTVQALWRAYGIMYQKAKESVDKTKTAFGTLYSKVREVVNNVLSTVKRITGIDISAVTGRLVQPFVNAYNRISREVDKIKAKASSVASAGGGIVNFFGFDIEGMLEAQASGNANVTKDINLNVDLANVPAGVSTETLIAVLTDPAVLQALVGNNDFQSLDAKVKNRLALKNGRARGV